MSDQKNKKSNFDYVANFASGGKSVMILDEGIDHDGFVSEKFCSEFKFLETFSSSIEIQINSSGGSVLSGLNIFTSILNSNTPTKTVVTGIAASMASVIALAADETVMNDYGLMMWHMPYSPSGESGEEEIGHFGKMLSKIYQERLGKSEEEIVDFMKGKDGQDGTWFDAEIALELGLISEIIPTGSQKSLIGKVGELESKLDGSALAIELQSIAANLNLENKDKNGTPPANGTADVVSEANKSVPKSNKKHTMDLSKISASLGIEDANLEAIEAKVEAVVAKNESLKKQVTEANKDVVAKDKALTESGIELASVSAKLEASESEKEEISTKVEGLEAKVAEFEAAAVEAQKEKIGSIVNKAEEEGKISSAAKATWTQLLEANFEGANEALNSLEATNGGKVKLSNAVKDTENKKEEKKEKPSYLRTVAGTLKDINAKKNK